MVLVNTYSLVSVHVSGLLLEETEMQCWIKETRSSFPWTWHFYGKRLREKPMAQKPVWNTHIMWEITDIDIVCYQYIDIVYQVAILVKKIEQG